MTDFLNALVILANFILVPGLAYGSQLALGALGVTLVYGVLRFSNFAHGETMAFGTMLVILVTWMLQGAGASFGPLPTALLALPIGIAGAVVLCLVTDRLVYRYYRRQRASSVIYLIVSVGVMFVYNGLIRFVIGPRDQNFTDGQRFIMKAREFKNMTGLNEGLAIKTTQAVTLGTAVVTVGIVFWFLNKTRTGKSMRAFSDNEDLALLSGKSGPRGDDRLDHDSGAGDHRRHALRPRQELQALCLSAASAADLRRGHRRRGGQPAWRHCRRFRHRLFRAVRDLRLQARGDIYGA